MNYIKTRTLGACVAAILVVFVFAARDLNLVYADEVDNEVRVDSQRIEKRLDSFNTPWYSNKTKEFKYLPLKKETGARHDRKTLELNNKVVELVMKVLAYTGIGVFVFLVIIAACETWKNVKLSRKEREDPEARKRRISALTKESIERYDDLLNAAIDALNAGDLRAATVFYFSWLLVEMDKREFIYLDKGKTNLEYWRELEGAEELRAIYRSTMRVFESTYFGAIPLTREEFDKMWLQKARFEEILRERDREKAASAAPPDVVVKLLLFCAVGGGCTLTGCENSQTVWKDKYACPAEYNKSKNNMNARGVFLKYGKKDRKWRINELGSYAYINHSDELDSVIWFTGSGYAAFENMSWDLGPIPQGEEVDSKTLESYEKCLRRYAEASDEDWADFALPNFFGIYEDVHESIEQWLLKKPGRVFIFVPEDYDALPRYLIDAREKIEDPALREECDERLQNIVLAETDAFSSYKNVFKMRRDFARKIVAKQDADGMFLKRMLLDEIRSSDGSGGDISELYPVDGSCTVEDDCSLTSANGYDFTDFHLSSIDADPAVCEAPFIGRFHERAIYERAINEDTKLDYNELRKIFETPNKFHGDPSWTSVLSEKGTWTSRFRIEPRGETKTLLALGDMPIVCERRYGQSRLLIVNSSRYFSNLGILDPTSRAVAIRVAQEIPKKSRMAVVDGVFMGFHSNVKSKVFTPGPFSLTVLSPYTIFVWHAFVLAAIAVFACYPIFGRPKRLRRERVNDFGLHIDAVADELEAIGAKKWAQEQLDAYHDADKLPEL